MNTIPRYRWVVIGLFWAFGAASSIGTLSLMMILPVMSKDLGATPMQAGWLSSMGWLVPAATSLAIGTLISRFSAKKSIAVSMFLGGLFLAGQGWAPTYGWEMAARIGYVITMVARQPSGALIIQQWFELREVAKINSLSNTIMSLGQMLAMGLTPAFVVLLSGWRPTFFLLGVIHILFAVIWLIYGREHSTPDYLARQLQQKGTPLKALARYPSLWAVASCQTGSAIAWGAFLTFMPTFLTDVRGVSLQLAGVLMAGLALGSIAGSFAAGVLTDKAGLNKPFIWTSGIGLIACYLGMVSIPSVPIAGILLFGAGFFAFVVVPIIHTIPYQLKGISPREVTIGLSLISTLTPLGASAGPLLAGYLQQTTGSLQFALFVCGFGAISLTIIGPLLPETGWRAKQVSTSTASLGKIPSGGG